MKALTICQPYAELIARGTKLVENRKWYTDYRGAIAIHAGKSIERFNGLPELDGVNLCDCHFGAIIAVATIYACLPINSFHMRHYSDQVPGQRAFVIGPYCWLLANVSRIQPIPCAGQQGLWDVAPSAMHFMDVTK